MSCRGVTGASARAGALAPGLAASLFTASSRTNPVAMTVILTVSVISLSITVPNMMFASESAVRCTRLDASATSCRVMSVPPVMLIRIPRAPSMVASSSSGEEIAFWAASTARVGPDATPVPIRAIPMPLMIVLTSAKSRLISPGMVIRSEIPCTAWRSTSSANRKAAASGIDLSTELRSFSLGMQITVSTLSCSSRSPCSACSRRFFPSKPNGLVTTATTRAPSSEARLATIGTAPVPVPPPRPEVMNTMSAPCSASMIFSESSSAAWRPMSGLLPAPSPLVSLPPPPPTPITLMLAPTALVSSKEIRGASLGARSSMRIIFRPPLEEFTQPASDHLAHAHQEERVGRPQRRAPALPGAVERQPHRRAVLRRADRLGQAAQARGGGAPDRHIQRVLGDLRDPLEHRSAAGEHHPRGERAVEAAAHELLGDEGEDLLDARLDDLAQDLARQEARLAPPHARNLHGFLVVHQCRQGAAVALLDLLGLDEGRAQPDRDVVGHVLPAGRQHRDVP